MAVSDTLIGSVFDGRYRIERKLGAGGMADVYLAEDQELGRRVAIKILNDRHAADDSFIERFRREAKNAAGLSHPNIVSIYDRGEAEGTYYIAMEYLEGRSLKELIVGRGPAPIKTAVDYARQILAALRYAHRNGVIHRDIKPHNVIVDSEGVVKVTDFGIARSGASQMTEAGSIIGTAQYLSPEQARGAHVDARSDIYSVGVVLYEMLTGEVPFTGDQPVEIAMKHLSNVPAPPSELNPKVPHDLDAIVLRALAKDPAQRYQSAEEMDAELGRVARGLAVSEETEQAATMVLAGAGTAAATSIMRPVRAAAPPAQYDTTGGYRREELYEYEEPQRRRPWWPWVLAALLIASAAVAGWYVWTQIQDQLDKSKPVAVPLVVGLKEANAEAQLEAAGLTARTTYRASQSVEKGFVISQDPVAGEKTAKGNQVAVVVSNGVPKTTVPDVVGKNIADAIAALTQEHLKYKVFEVNSDKEANTVTATAPGAGAVVQWDTEVRVNVSKGPKPVVIPSGLIGQPYANALGALQGAGFAVKRTDVESDQPKDTVVAVDPASGTAVAPGSTVTLSVSKGPKTATVPDVTSYSEADARSALRSAGFTPGVVRNPTTDPTLDGVVISQTPGGGEQAKPGSRVTIVVGKLATPAATTTTQAQTPTPTTTAPPPEQVPPTQ